MKIVIQRVVKADVAIEDQNVAHIDNGLLVFLGVGISDSESDVSYMVDKLVNLRVFEDELGKLHYSVLEKQRPVLVVPQFTIMGSCRKGRRPDFTQAASAEDGKFYFALFVDKLKNKINVVKHGVFKAHMHVSLVNDGPLTLIVDSKESGRCQ